MLEASFQKSLDDFKTGVLRKQVIYIVRLRAGGGRGVGPADAAERSRV